MITVLSGGTGTPKLLQGIKEVYNQEDINIIVNTLENNYFSGVYVSADIDTVLYTMADIINDETWYGIKEDTFITHNRLKELGMDELLKIGDIDRATKIQKTILMEKYDLKKAVDIQRQNMGIKSHIFPMSNENSEITIVTDIGELEFHDFLIKHQCEPKVLDLKFNKVNPCDGIIELIENSDKIIIGPSNPITSILPIISLKGVKNALKKNYVIAVSPIIGQNVVSGPANKFMKAFGVEISPIGIANFYKEFLDCLIIDNKDKDLKNDINKIIPKTIYTNTIMKTIDDKINLANTILK